MIFLNSVEQIRRELHDIYFRSVWKRVQIYFLRNGVPSLVYFTLLLIKKQFNWQEGETQCFECKKKSVHAPNNFSHQNNKPFVDSHVNLTLMLMRKITSNQQLHFNCYTHFKFILYKKISRSKRVTNSLFFLLTYLWERCIKFKSRIFYGRSSLFCLYAIFRLT